MDNKVLEIKINSLEDLEMAAYKFMTEMDDFTVFAFYGQMGAGKTTFINELCRQLGVETDTTNSPSFAIINEYRSDTTAELIYHFDCYRLENEQEAVDIGAEDYFDSGAVCLIEWPERIEGLLPDDTVRVDLTVNDDETRLLKVTFPDID
ncbi:MAG: tRNA (adenosine(37)-N6)-threonylcarbamoyltransferase complex ATPase subunit type 1 TsaE [Muribaculaceae bacterium]|nr:tRNA (adenosine(37)-N6)-threonylcarbamoyltransferase complex ATPase subunit type 1 TsaE [Muribaculaceae bacterium]MBQ5466527.1 tRNA (adenosine(37)-N6)-threonylcarbamoyltransferase complex ATPase subunit type 1 TsaE [Muribaculaceae bacterium]